MKPQLFLVTFLLFVGSAIAQKQEKYSRAKIYLDSREHNIKVLSSLGVAVDHGEYKKNTFFVADFSASELKQIKKAGFKVSIQIKDVSKHYRDQNKKDTKPAQKTTSGTGCATPAINTPAHFALGSYAGFFTYAEMLDILDSMHALYPGLISAKQPIDTFHTIEGRPIYWVRMSDNPSVNQPAKPQMLTTAVHHAREPGSLSSTLYYMWHMLENYSSDPRIKAIIDNTELYFVPCLNPDGYLYNISTNPSGGGMWRKNKRDNLDGTLGVDLNRNYGFKWAYDNIGSSPVTSSQTYRGTDSFSEPETQAIKWMAEQHHFLLNLNYHTYNNDLIYPWGYIASFLTPDSAQFHAIGSHLTTENHYRYGTGDQTLNYITNGDSDDWMYGEQTTKNKILAFTPEVGSNDFGFYPPASSIIPDCNNNLAANVKAAAMLIPYAVVKNTDEKIITTTTGNFHFNLQRLGFRDTTYTIHVTPLDSWLTLPTATHSFSSLALLQSVNDSFAYTIAASTPNGQRIRYEVKLGNGFYTTSDTVEFYYGKYYSNIFPSTNTFADWTNSGWGLCNSIYYSSPTSIGSSVTGCDTYAINSDITLKLTQQLDLTHALQSFLYFYGRWGIESTYDYVTIEAAPAGTGAWQPLCGRFTKPGTMYQLHDLPIYDGQQPTWVQEEVDLHDFIGQKIDLQFELVSDAAVTYSGFFVDDVNIISIKDSTTSVNPVVHSAPTVNIFPNPAQDNITITVSGYSFQAPIVAGIYDFLGRKVMSLTLSQATNQINTTNLSSGMYYCKPENDATQFPVTRIEILK